MIDNQRATQPIFGRLAPLLAILAFAVVVESTAMAAAPDLTAGGLPDNSDTINLGPTGACGWVYDGGAIVRTRDSRQFLVSEVDAGYPADGVLLVDDVMEPNQ